mmetsp:Transcript_82857/g.238071  ORF Transcript_82857/g.238071 Transcript_82857/m.238071 type:complete len:248 (+) Transcript_82857:75-818(+)
MGAHCVRAAPRHTSEDQLQLHMPQPVTLNIYNVGNSDQVNILNRMLRPLGAGAFHCAVEVFGAEWSYGDYDEGSGVFSCQPRVCEGHRYCESVKMGKTTLKEGDFAKIMKLMEMRWLGKEYDILRKNCCHFCDEVLSQLNVACMPAWVTNLATAAAALQSAGECMEKKRRSLGSALPTLVADTLCCGCEVQSGKAQQVEIISASPTRRTSMEAAAARMDGFGAGSTLAPRPGGFAEIPDAKGFKCEH